MDIAQHFIQYTIMIPMKHTWWCLRFYFSWNSFLGWKQIIRLTFGMYFTRYIKWCYKVHRFNDMFKRTHLYHCICPPLHSICFRHSVDARSCSCTGILSLHHLQISRTMQTLVLPRPCNQWLKTYFEPLTIEKQTNRCATCYYMLQIYLRRRNRIAPTFIFQKEVPFGVCEYLDLNTVFLCCV